jgi:hypothetical protein
MKNTDFWGVTPCILVETGQVSVELVALIFRVEVGDGMFI